MDCIVHGFAKSRTWLSDFHSHFHPLWWERQVDLCDKFTATAASLQSCPTLCDPIDGSPQAPPSLGFSRQEHWSGLPFPSPMRESEVTQSYPTLATPWTAAHQAPPSLGFSRKEHWSGVPLPSLVTSLLVCKTQSHRQTLKQTNGSIWEATWYI